MDKIQLAKELSQTIEPSKIVYLRMEPEVVDYTTHQSGKFILSDSIEIPFDRNNIRDAISFLDVSVFTGKMVLGWNFKNIVSYIQHYSKKPRNFDCELYDLKIIEAFLEQRNKKPASMTEAVNRAMKIKENKSWKTIWNEIHLPLITRVLPTLENSGIVDLKRRCTVFPYYELEGAVSGRLSCHVLGKGYSPHALGEQDYFKPRGDDEVFLYFDYKSMEVSVLHHLAKDQALGAILARKEDMYASIWERLTGLKPDTQDRERCKLTFLPVMYGMGAETLSKNQGWTIEISKEIIRRIRECFPEAYGFMRGLQEIAKTNCVVDPFGRQFNCREKPYIASNRIVQSTAAVICLEKLIRLHDEIPSLARIGFNVHDGYGLFCDMRDAPEVCHMVFKILESDSRLMPGLKLKSAATIGSRLNKMIAVPDQWRSNEQ